jgi:hypothetical protein
MTAGPGADARESGAFARAWSEALSDRGFRFRLAAVVPALVLVLAGLARFLERVEARPGAVLPDPLLALLPPRDLTWLTFGLIYLGLAAGVGWLASRPRRLLLALQAYVVMVAFRVLAMWATPLEAPPGLLPLNDPLVRLFGPAKLLTKDLFFSGHTATLFLLALAVTAPRLRALFLACTAAVAACVLAQHVHYTIDVLAAPFFVYGSWRVAGLLGTGGAGGSG